MYAPITMNQTEESCTYDEFVVDPLIEYVAAYNTVIRKSPKVRLG